MKYSEQAIRFGMSERHGVYEKDINGFKMQFVLRARPGAVVKLPHTVFVFNRSLDKNDRQAIFKVFGMMKNVAYVDSVGLPTNAIFMYGNLYHKSEKSMNKFNQKLRQLTDIFTSLGLVSLSSCPFCHSDELTDGHRTINGVVVDVHESCVQSFVKQADQEIAQEEKSKGLVKSLGYAFIGAIFGAIPAIIALNFGYFVGLLFILIPLASFYFYKFGKGPKTIVAIVGIALISLLLVPGILVTLYHLAAMVDGLTLFEAIEADPDFSTEFYSNLGLSFLFSVIGIAVTWSYMFKQSTSASKKEIDNLR